MRTQAECEYLIRKKGLATEESLCVRPLTEKELLAMPEPVYEWHLRANKENVEKALAARNAQPPAPSFEKLSVEYPELVNKLLREYPQLLNTPENADAINKFILAKAPYVQFTFAELREAFEKCAYDGRLVLNPSACDAGSETEVTGHKLRTHSNLHKLLAPYNSATREKHEFGKMSAKDYKAASIRENPEDWPDAVPPELVQRKIDRVVTDFFGLHPEHAPSDETMKVVRKFFDGMGWGAKDWNLTNLSFAFEQLIESGAIKPVTNPEGLRVAGQVTRVTDLKVGREHRPGWPVRSTKSSFNKKTDNLTAEEFKNEIATDPAYREALDRLGSR